MRSLRGGSDEVLPLLPLVSVAGDAVLALLLLVPFQLFEPLLVLDVLSIGAGLAADVDVPAAVGWSGSGTVALSLAMAVVVAGAGSVAGIAAAAVVSVAVVVLGMADVSACATLGDACELSVAPAVSAALSVGSLVAVDGEFIAQPAAPRIRVAVAAATPADKGLNFLLMMRLQR